MTGVPFDDLLMEIDRDAQNVSTVLRESIRDGRCTMDAAMDALREAAIDFERARNPVVAKHHIGEIANGLRFADLNAFNDWVARNGSVLGQGIIKYMPDEPERDYERPTVMGVLKRVFLGRE